MKKHIINLPDEIASISLGSALASVCQQACMIYLYGDLGTGKTTFCRGFLRELGYIGHVKSPTYLLVETYVLPRWTVYHFDLYRLMHAEDLELMGIRDYFNETALCLVEWPQRGKGILPEADIVLTIHYQGDSRQMEVQALSATGAYSLAQLLPLLSCNQETKIQGDAGVSFIIDSKIINSYGS